jgi:biopolymer transport protein ExbB
MRKQLPLISPASVRPEVGQAMDCLNQRRKYLSVVLAQLSIFGTVLAFASVERAHAQYGRPPAAGFSQPSVNSGLMPVQSTQPNYSNTTTGGWSSTPDVRIASAMTVTGTPAVTTTSDSGGAGAGGTIRSLLQIFHDGGILMYPIAICSFVMMAFFFERFIALRPGRVIPRPFINRLLEQLEQQQIDREEASELCSRNPSPMSQIAAAALKRYGRPAVEVEQMVLDAGERVTNQLRRYLRIFSAISNVSPLLGLLGTVLGMIEAFNAISSGNGIGRPDVLAGGISTALLTTAAGLVVAIPAYLAYMYFVGRTDRLVMEMDQYAQRVVEAVCSEGIQESESRSRSRTRRAA